MVGVPVLESQACNFHHQQQSKSLALFSLSPHIFPFIHDTYFNLPIVFSDSPLDLKIKSHLVSDMFNLTGKWLTTAEQYFVHLWPLSYSWTETESQLRAHVIGLGFAWSVVLFRTNGSVFRFPVYRGLDFMNLVTLGPRDVSVFTSAIMLILFLQVLWLMIRWFGSFPPGELSIIRHGIDIR